MGVAADGTTGSRESPTLLSNALYFVELSLPLWNIPMLWRFAFIRRGNVCASRTNI